MFSLTGRADDWRVTFREYIWEQENAARYGFDAARNVWRPYQDGRAKAVGPGIRVERPAAVYTQLEVRVLLERQIDIHWLRARKAVNKHYGAGSWDRLTPRQQYGLVDFWYNGAPALRLAGGMLRADSKTIELESVRFWTVDGRKIPLTRRNQAWARTFGSDSTALTSESPPAR